MSGTVLGVALVSAGFVALFGVTWWLRRHTETDPEILRKALHVGMGSIVLPAPWLFETSEPVLYLGAASVVVLCAVRFVPVLRRTAGEVLFAVGRPGWGELYFVAGVVATFVIAGGNPVRYCLPIAILTYADAAASLVGSRAARRAIRAPGKTFAGSMAFAITATIVSGIGFAIADVEPYWRFVLFTALLALLTTLAEALGRRGLDNLAIPVTATIVLSWLGVG